MRRTVEWAEGALPEICERAITQILEDAGPVTLDLRTVVIRRG